MTQADRESAARRRLTTTHGVAGPSMSSRVSSSTPATCAARPGAAQHLAPRRDGDRGDGRGPHRWAIWCQIGLSAAETRRMGEPGTTMVENRPAEPAEKRTVVAACPKSRKTRGWRQAGSECQQPHPGGGVRCRSRNRLPGPQQRRSRAPVRAQPAGRPGGGGPRQCRARPGRVRVEVGQRGRAGRAVLAAVPAGRRHPPSSSNSPSRCCGDCNATSPSGWHHRPASAPGSPSSSRCARPGRTTAGDRGQGRLTRAELSQRTDSLFDPLEAQIDGLRSAEQQEAADSKRGDDAGFQQTRCCCWAASCSPCSSGCLVVLLLSRNIVPRIRRYSQFATEIAAGSTDRAPRADGNRRDRRPRRGAEPDDRPARASWTPGSTARSSSSTRCR